jgi:Cytochrome c552
MKTSRLVALLFLLPLIALWGCEGDQGPAGIAGTDGTNGTNGTNGTDGVDGEVSCLVCHGDAAQDAINLQYERSHHAAGLYVEYTQGDGYLIACARCHNGVGYAEFIDTGETDGPILNAVPIGCVHCHTVHSTFEETDFALRGAEAAPWIADVGLGDTSFDFGDNSNVCANCHQSRRAEPNLTDPGATFEITSTHYGPHHGAMANVVAGFGFAEIAGSTAYPTTNNVHQNANVTCVTCHMADYSNGEGGHTWWPNLDACNACHSAPDLDFNHNDVQSDTQVLLDTLRDLLLAQDVIEWVVADEAYEPIVGIHTMVQAQAFFNWIGLTEDRSVGVHNPGYVEALLENSIEAITAGS